MTDKAEKIPLLWGVSAIAGEIGRTPRQTHHMLEQGHLPAKKVGGRWCANRADLVAFFKMEKAG